MKKRRNVATNANPLFTAREVREVERDLTRHALTNRNIGPTVEDLDWSTENDGRVLSILERGREIARIDLDALAPRLTKKQLDDVGTLFALYTHALFKLRLAAPAALREVSASATRDAGNAKSIAARQRKAAAHWSREWYERAWAAHEDAGNKGRLGWKVLNSRAYKLAMAAWKAEGSDAASEPQYNQVTEARAKAFLAAKRRA